MENLLILQDFVPYRGRCPATAQLQPKSCIKRGKGTADHMMPLGDWFGLFGPFSRSFGLAQPISSHFGIFEQQLQWGSKSCGVDRFLCLYMCTSIQPPSAREPAMSEGQPVRTRSHPANLRTSQPDLRASQPGLLARLLSQLGLPLSQQGLRARQPGLKSHPVSPPWTSV